MTITFTKEQFRELLLNVLIGIFLREAVAESEDEPFEHLRAIEGYLLTYAEENGMKELTDRTPEGTLLPAEEILDEEESVIDFYSDDAFWDELARRLGQRDFERTMTLRDRLYLKRHGGVLPERAFELYEKYDAEFENFGIDRLEINESASVLEEEPEETE